MLDHMSGLRRVTLNRNPLIADRGATFLAEVLEADLWIKGKECLAQDFSRATKRTDYIRSNNAFIFFELDED